jgi:predicted NAD-dependent protein-ADP-ribosyltransferase YbiA (DUF1768 family)
MNSDILYYYSGSANKVPGKGVNETVSQPSNYIALRNIPNWRRVLSNFYEGEFVYRGLWYRTVEHAWQGRKISYADETKATYFSMDSNHYIGREGGDIARSNRKMVILSRDQIREWETSDEIEEILYAKFSQVPLAREVLLATHDAQLWHGAPRTPKKRQTSLENVRRRLRG